MYRRLSYCADVGTAVPFQIAPPLPRIGCRTVSIMKRSTTPSGATRTPEFTRAASSRPSRPAPVRIGDLLPPSTAGPCLPDPANRPPPRLCWSGTARSGWGESPASMAPAPVPPVQGSQPAGGQTCPTPRPLAAMTFRGCAHFDTASRRAVYPSPLASSRPRPQRPPVAPTRRAHAASSAAHEFRRFSPEDPFRPIRRLLCRGRPSRRGVVTRAAPLPSRVPMSCASTLRRLPPGLSHAPCAKACPCQNCPCSSAQRGRGLSCCCCFSDSAPLGASPGDAVARKQNRGGFSGAAPNNATPERWLWIPLSMCPRACGVRCRRGPSTASSFSQVQRS